MTTLTPGVCAGAACTHMHTYMSVQSQQLAASAAGVHSAPGAVRVMHGGCLCWSSGTDVWVVLLPVRRSDISVWNRIRVVPTIYFYDEGAVVSFAAWPESAVVLGWRTHLHCPQGASALCTRCGAATPACSEPGRGGLCAGVRRRSRRSQCTMSGGWERTTPL